MALTINTADFTDEVTRKNLLQAASQKSPSIQYLNKQAGVKYKTNLHTLTADVVFSDGKTCGFTAAGSDTISKRTIETATIKVNKSICKATMITKFTNYDMTNIAGDETLPFKDDFLKGYVESIKKTNEKLIWQGDTTKTGTALVNYDGFLKIAKADGGIDGGVAKSNGTISSLVRNMISKSPAEVENKVMFVGKDMFQNYMLELGDKNLFNMPTATDNSVMIPATNIKMIAVSGLTASDYAVLADPMNLVYGFDIENSEESYDFWYSKDQDMYNFKVLFNAGVQIAFPNEVVYGRIAA